MARTTRKPVDEPIGVSLPQGADTTKVTAILTYDEAEELRRFLHSNRKQGSKIGQMEWIRFAILRAMREKLLPER